MSLRSITPFAIALLAFTSNLFAQTSLPIQIDYDKKVSEIKPTMWGIFFEDINFAADGGIYAELIKNRSFEFDQPLMGWKENKGNRFSLNKESGAAMVISRGEDVANPRFARFNINAETGYSITNEGFRGMGIKKEMQYNFSVLASQPEGSKVKLRIELVDSNGNVIGAGALAPSGAEWKKYNVSFVATATEPKAKLTMWFDGQGTIDLDMVSLFPNDTWKQRPGGLRADLIQLLADLKPGFLRFPGGCIVEGRELATRYQWKKTVGNVEDREMIVNRWNTEFKHRPAPDYFQTFGLGFFEYFQVSEDIGAEPLPILSCGLACQFNTAEVVPMEDLDPYIQDALDLIEFANGAPTTKWGKLRADMGHPEPFNMKFIGIGNEQWGPQYIERYKAFAAAIKPKYPDITLVSGSGPFPDGEMFEFANEELKKLDAKIVDEHYYKDPEWFRKNATRYDSYDRNGAKIFAGEYAAQSVAIASPDNKNNWECALAEAAFMTGLERNADVVHLTSYAPLFAHVEGWQWTPDLIWFDNLRSFGTPNYYVQKLFATNRGTHLLKATNNNAPLTGQQDLYATAAWDKTTNELVVKIVNTSADARTADLTLKGSGKAATTGTIVTLAGNDGNAVNSIEDPTRVSPKEETVRVNAKKTTLTLAPASLSVLRVKITGAK
jgi:alpha-N-arabinofuranosidase